MWGTKLLSLCINTSLKICTFSLMVLFSNAYCQLKAIIVRWIEPPSKFLQSQKVLKSGRKRGPLKLIFPCTISWWPFSAWIYYYARSYYYYTIIIIIIILWYYYTIIQYYYTNEVNVGKWMLCKMDRFVNKLTVDVMVSNTSQMLSVE